MSSNSEVELKRPKAGKIMPFTEKRYAYPTTAEERLRIPLTRYMIDQHKPPALFIYTQHLTTRVPPIGTDRCVC